MRFTPEFFRRRGRRASDWATRLKAASIAPRRLEPRRLLDAGVAVPVLKGLEAVGDSVLVGEPATDGVAQPTEDAEAFLHKPPNIPPHNLTLLPQLLVAEDGTAYLGLAFQDPNIFDTHTLSIDWGDGSPAETFNLPTGTRFVIASHQYLDDNPTGTPVDLNSIEVTVSDNHGGSVTETAPIVVLNIPPDDAMILPVDAIDENGSAILRLTFDDPGTQDTHTVEIDWGDGTPIETVVLSTGSRSLVTSHQYLDDNPTATSSDSYEIRVRVLDDDGGQTGVQTQVLVRNVAPDDVTILPIDAIDENSSAILRLTFDDPGTQDTHTVEIDWGDGTPVETVAISPGARSLITNHQYLDDNPTGTPADSYQIQVRVLDDDGGVGIADAQVLVQNVAPEVTILPVDPIYEDGTAILRLTFDDPGTQDTHTVEIDWGDGTAVEAVVLPAGARTLVTSHQYKDDNPTGTSSDTYQIQVRVIDDDGGVGLANAEVLVANVPPGSVTILPVDPIDENGFAILRLTFDDPGTQDTHTVEIDWGDGTPVETVTLTQGARSLVTSHQYLDDNPTGTPADTYQIQVRVLDDDGGVGLGNAEVLVRNVAPDNVTILPVDAIYENDSAILRLTFDDPGTQDTHTVEIDWGDGTPVETINLTQGARSLVTSHQYLDDNPTGTPADTYQIQVRVLDDDGGVGLANTEVLVQNVAPDVTILPVDPIYENDLAILRLTFDDPGTQDTHTVEIDWGDGTPVETVNLTQGARSLVTSHQYLDDNPTGTPADTYQIQVRVLDDDGGIGLANAEVLVQNVAPDVTILPVDPIYENDFAILRLTFDDPGTQDTHYVEIDWGDGTPTETVALVPGARSLVTSHQYPDDNPTGTPADIYQIQVRVVDDDGGVGLASADVLVQNVAPQVTVLPVDAINESETATLEFSFTEVGPEDTHTVEIDWGDGTPVETIVLTPGQRSLVITHTYVDDVPTGTNGDLIPIQVRVIDDDTGVGVANTTVLVRNVDPTLLTLGAPDVSSAGGTTLSGTFNDPGADNPLANPQTYESFVLEIDWGDGIIELVPISGPTPTGFSVVHVYTGPPDPLNPAADIEIKARIIDDDGGYDFGSVTVSNPGINDEPIVFIFESEVPQLTFPSTDLVEANPAASATGPEGRTSSEIRASSGQLQAATERYFELRFRKTNGQWSEGFRLKPQVMNDLPALFLKLPDNRWAIFLIRRETNTERLVIEFDTRGGRVIDPGDDTEGGRDRPPMEEPLTLPQEDLLPQEEASPQDNPAGLPTPEAATQPAVQPAPAAASAALAAALVGRPRQRGLQRSLESATPADWRRLRRRRKKRPPIR